MAKEWWLYHQHIGKNNTPLTVYIADRPGRYELWYGKTRYENLSLPEVQQKLGEYLLRGALKENKDKIEQSWFQRS